MSDVADRDKPVPFGWLCPDLDELVFFFAPLYIAGLLAMVVGYVAACLALIAWALALSAVSMFVYPVAHLFGFKPRRWWVKSEITHKSQYVLNLPGIVIIAVSAISGAIALLPILHW